MANLYKRPRDGVYLVQFRDSRGRQCYKSLKTRDEALATRKFNQWLNDRIAQKVRPIASGARITLKTFVEEFLKNIQAQRSSSTYTLYSVALQKAVSAWGDIPMSHITTRHVSAYLSDLSREGLAAPTINKNYRHLKSALKTAMEWEYLQPFKKWSAQVPERKQARYLTTEQIQALTAKIDDSEFLDFCLFSAYTGLRSGEILRLTWSDIDTPVEGLLRVTSMQKNREESYIPISTNARAILDQCKGRNGRKVFRFNTLTWVSQKFKAYARSAGIGHAKFHDLRHSFGSYLAMGGENLAAIQKLMRHKSIQSTLVYAKFSDEALKQASEHLDYGINRRPALKVVK